MDAPAFDVLARAVNDAWSRRGLLRRLAAVPFAGGLAALPGAAEIVAKKRKHKKKKRKKKTCTAQPISTTCAGKCGSVKNNCGQTVNCTCPTGECCGGEGTCGACLTFVTSTTHSAAFNGLTGADAICQDLADMAGLPGAYLAWLSDAEDSPSTRFVQATVPYTLVDGTLIATNWGALTSGTLAHGINLSETGEEMGTHNVWTNTLADGTPGGIHADGHCETWSSGSHSPIVRGNTGFSGATTASWTRFSDHECDSPYGLYCFQQR